MVDSQFSGVRIKVLFVSRPLGQCGNRLKAIIVLFHNNVVLYCIDWVAIATLMHCDLFDICCAPPNLGITRTWICRLNFDQRPICLGLRFFNEPETSDSGPPSLKSLPEDLCSGFLRPEKIHRPQSDFNPQILDLEASTLPRDYRGWLLACKCNV